MADLKAHFNAQELVNYADAIRANEEPSLWERLFPAETAPSLELKWIKSTRRKTVILQASALDETAPRRSRLGAEKIITDMPFFRESMPITEKDRQELLKLIDAANNRQSEIDSILSDLYEAHAGLILGAYGDCDVMAGMLITGGKIDIVAPDNKGTTSQFSYDYDDDAGTWKSTNVTQLSGTGTWTTANKATSTPMQDILNAIQAQEDRGYRVSRIVMNSATFKAFCESDSIQKTIMPLGGVVRKADARAFIENEAEIDELIVYNKTYADHAGNIIKVIPDGFVVLLTDQMLGKMYFGPTPEIFDKAYNQVPDGRDVAVSQFDGKDCVSVECYTSPNPVCQTTIASMAALPSFTEMDGVAVIKTTE